MTVFSVPILDFEKKKKGAFLGGGSQFQMFFCILLINEHKRTVKIFSLMTTAACICVLKTERFLTQEEQFIELNLIICIYHDKCQYYETVVIVFLDIHFNYITQSEIFYVFAVVIHQDKSLSFPKMSRHKQNKLPEYG